MCQLLIRIQDRNPGKPGAFTAGDVVCCLPDDHQFSSAELTDPFRVVKIAGLAPDAMRTYLLGNASTRRSQGFDLNSALGGLLLATEGRVTTLTREGAWAMLGLSRERPGL